MFYLREQSHRRSIAFTISHSQISHCVLLGKSFLGINSCESFCAAELVVLRLSGSRIQFSSGIFHPAKNPSARLGFCAGGSSQIILASKI